MIYLDHNATTEPSPSVKAFIKDDLVNHWANASSEHAWGVVMSDDIKICRATIAETLGVSTKGLIFTSGATESINTVMSLDNLKRLGVSKIFTSHLEHHATLDRVKYLAKNGFVVGFIPNDQEGKLDLEFLKSNVTSDSIVSVLVANNEIGTISPVKLIAEIVHERNGYIHVDAVQSWGKIKVDLEDWDVDFASFSGHKIGALKGIGLLYARDIKNLPPLIHGGGQERGYRPGTLNSTGIKSLALAASDISLGMMNEVQALRDYLEKEILKTNLIQVNAANSSRLPNTTNLFMGGRSSREILLELSRKEIYVSTGSACSAGSFEPSHVISALGYDAQRGLGSLRISMSSTTTKAEIDTLIVELKRLVAV